MFTNTGSGSPSLGAAHVPTVYCTPSAVSASVPTGALGVYHQKQGSKQSFYLFILPLSVHAFSYTPPVGTDAEAAES
jgi:hypothetical protein